MAVDARRQSHAYVELARAERLVVPALGAAVIGVLAGGMWLFSAPPAVIVVATAAWAALLYLRSRIRNS